MLNIELIASDKRDLVMARLKILSLRRFIGTGSTKRSLPKLVLKPVDSNVLVDSFGIGVSAVKA